MENLSGKRIVIAGGSGFLGDRTWELPKHPWIMRMTWSELLFAHWPVEPQVLAPLLPKGLTLDTRDGKAWIGVVPFEMSLKKDASEAIDYRSDRTHRGEPPAMFDASYRAIGGTFHAQLGTLEHWLTARYCLYSADRKGRLYRGEIDHDPWTLAPASWTKRQNTMCDPWGIEVIDLPHLLFAQPVEVRAWMAIRCD